MRERFYLAYRKNKTKPTGIVVRRCGPKGGNVTIRWFSEVGELLKGRDLDRYYFYLITYFPTPEAICPMVVGAAILTDEVK